MSDPDDLMREQQRQHLLDTINDFLSDYDEVAEVIANWDPEADVQVRPRQK